jgi:hypothetical protein
MIRSTPGLLRTSEQTAETQQSFMAWTTWIGDQPSMRFFPPISASIDSARYKRSSCWRWASARIIASSDGAGFGIGTPRTPPSKLMARPLPRASRRAFP